MDSSPHARDEHHHHHHELPTSGGALDAVAFSATLHCLTGCAIGEVLGMVIGTALGFSDLGTILLAVALAFLFGYSLTSLPLLRAGLALSAVAPIAFATDTFSIATMEIVDNAIMLVVPGAMEAGAGNVLFWGALSVALVIAGVVAFPVNRWLITRGRGHAVLHESGHHPNFPTRLVAVVAAVAFAFGATVLVADALESDGMEGHGGGHGGAGEAEPAAVRGLSASDAGMTLVLTRDELAPGRRAELSFQIEDSNGAPVRDYEVEHTKRMHLIVVRRDLTGFQHLHPRLRADGTWATPVELREPGAYRVFADFKRDGANRTLATDLTVRGAADTRPLPPPRAVATVDGYAVRSEGTRSRAGSDADLRFEVTRGGRPVEVEPYLGADGHLVALREGDLAYLHVHPVEAGGEHDGGHGAAAGEGIAFETRFPTDGRYRLFLQFKHDGAVHTAEWTRTVG